MTTSSVRTLVLLPSNGVVVATTRHSSGVSWSCIDVLPRKTETGVRVPKDPYPGNRIVWLLLAGLARRFLPLDGRLHQAREERVRAGRAGAQLRVRLGGDQVGVHLARVLDVLDELVVRGRAREDDA